MHQEYFRILNEDVTAFVARIVSLRVSVKHGYELFLRLDEDAFKGTVDETDFVFVKEHACSIHR